MVGGHQTGAPGVFLLEGLAVAGAALGRSHAGGGVVVATLAQGVRLGVEALGQRTLGDVLQHLHMAGVVELHGLVILGDGADGHHFGLGHLDRGGSRGLGVLVAGHAGGLFRPGRNELMAARALLLLGLLVVAAHATGLGLRGVHGLGELDVAALRRTLAGVAGRTGVHGAGMVAAFAIADSRLVFLMVEHSLGQWSLAGFAADGGAA